MNKKIKIIMLCFLIFFISSCNIKITIGTNYDSSNSSINNSSLTTQEELYDLYLSNGGTLSYEEWLKTIKGDKGEPGDTPYIGENGNWWIGDEDTGVKAEVSVDEELPFILASNYGVLPGDVDSNKLQNIIDDNNLSNKTILFEDGTYNFSTTIYLKSNVTLLGNANTIFSLDENSTSKRLIEIKNVDNVGVKNLKIKGFNISRPTTIGEKTGLWIESSRSVNLENLDIFGWGKYGVYGKTMSSYGTSEEGKFYKQLQLLNTRFYYNYYGTYFDYRCEYTQVLNCVFGENYIGSLNCGGNNMYVSCMYNANDYGIVIENNGSNPAHGSCNSSTFNHNYSNAILITDCINGWTFNGCQIFYGKIEVINSIGVIFSSCIFGSCKYISTNEKKNVNLITDSYFLTNSQDILKGNDGSTYITNCLPDFIEEDEVVDDSIECILDTYGTSNQKKLPLSTNAYSGATGHSIKKNQRVSYVDFEVYGASKGVSISGINVWVINNDTNEVVEQLIENETIEVTYSKHINEYVIRYFFNKAFDFNVSFIVQATRVNGINIAYYDSKDSDIQGYLVGDVAPKISDKIESNSTIIPIYRAYMEKE